MSGFYTSCGLPRKVYFRKLDYVSKLYAPLSGIQSNVILLSECRVWLMLIIDMTVWSRLTREDVHNNNDNNNTGNNDDSNINDNKNDDNNSGDNERFYSISPTIIFKETLPYLYITVDPIHQRSLFPRDIYQSHLPVAREISHPISVILPVGGKTHIDVSHIVPSSLLTAGPPPFAPCYSSSCTPYLITHYI